jgi:hypothetical protein
MSRHDTWEAQLVGGPLDGYVHLLPYGQELYTGEDLGGTYVKASRVLHHRGRLIVIFDFKPD